MAVPTDRTALNLARSALLAARSNVIAALYDADQKARALSDAERHYPATNTVVIDARAAKAAADAALLGYQDLERSARGDLHARIAEWLDAASLADDVARLRAKYPIVFFPVRLETKFDLAASPAVLRVRVYPDVVSLQTHERALTSEERDRAIDYYTRLAAGEPETTLWRELVARFPAARAAYVLREMLPTVDGGMWSSCGSTTLGDIDESLVFPSDIQLRPSTWSRPGEAVMPDRWVLALYRRGTRRLVEGGAIIEPLAMTLDPNLPATHLSRVNGDRIEIDDNLRWTFDYDRAVQVGMAFSPIELSTAEASLGFDRVIVFGVKSSLTPDRTSELIEDLIDGHHYTRGVAIVPQGSATNNTDVSKTPYPVKDDGGAVSFPIERDPPPLQRRRAHHCPPFNDDGTALMTLLGCPNGVAKNLQGADGHEQTRSRAMNNVLWGSTLGYYLEQLMYPVFSRSDIASTQSYFEKYVRGRGPAPVFRIGQVPYGVLPITSIYRWQQRSFGQEEQLESRFIDELRVAFSHFRSVSKRVPQIRARSSDPLADLAIVGSTTPSSREFRVRYGQGEITWYHQFKLLGGHFEPVRQRMREAAERILAWFNHADWDPRIGHVTLNPESYLYTIPIVAPDVTASALDPNYLLGIRDATLDQLRYNQIPTQVPSILYYWLRLSALYTYAWHMNGEIERRDPTYRWIEQELWHIRVAAPPTIWDLFERNYPDLGRPLWEWARDQAFGFRDSLTILAGADVPELERLCSETLDLGSHRLDAWITAVATRRLLETRESQIDQYMKPFGNYLGGYGWVENLRPVTRSYEQIEGLGSVEVPEFNGGFIHAPSLAHAATAAVLRSAYLSHKQEDPKKFAIDLCSRKVRLARELMHEARHGQNLGSVLGYRFERALRDRSGFSLVDKDSWRLALRRLYPAVAKKRGSAADLTEPTESIAAENVVDGFRLYSSRNQIPWGTQGLPAAGSQASAAIAQEIAALTQHIDAVNDLSLAEGVHHLLQRNVDRSLAASRASQRGERPSDPHVALSPRNGTALTHRVVLRLPEAPTSPTPQWPSTSTRGSVEPALDYWVGLALGDPANVRATVVAPGSPDVSITLADLALRPLDVLALAQPHLRSAQGALIDQRILVRALGDTAAATTATVDHTPSATGEYRSFPDVLEQARALAALLSQSRTLWLDDLASPTDAEDFTTVYSAELEQAATDAETRATTVFGSLTTVVSQLSATITALESEDPSSADPSALRALLRGAVSEYLPASAFAAPQLSVSGTLELGKRALSQLQKSLEQVVRLGTDPSAAARARFKRAEEKLQALLGTGFLVTALVQPPASPELLLSLEDRASLLGADDRDVERFLAKTAHVRPGLARWRRTALYNGVLGQAEPRRDVVQLPHVPGARWLGRTLAGQVPQPGCLSLILLSTDGLEPDPTASWRGLVLDEWVEKIANSVEETGVAFHYDTPGVEAPNCVLVATPASTGTSWSAEDVLAALEETLELVHARGVDGDLHQFGQLLPATGVARNHEETTISDLAGNIARAAVNAAKALISRS